VFLIPPYCIICFLKLFFISLSCFIVYDLSNVKCPLWSKNVIQSFFETFLKTETIFFVKKKCFFGSQTGFYCLHFSNEKVLCNKLQFIDPIWVIMLWKLLYANNAGYYLFVASIVFLLVFFCDTEYTILIYLEYSQ